MNKQSSTQQQSQQSGIGGSAPAPTSALCNVLSAINALSTNMVSTLNKSVYGLFVDAISKVNINVQDYEVPSIIVIGAESSGKSSLLENITNAELFPKNNKTCTKQPIKLKLKPAMDENEVQFKLTYDGVTTQIKQKESIVKKVEEIMATLTEFQISEKEIVIEITDFNLPVMEIIDLPGIRAYPPSMAEQTTSLCEKYLTKQHVIPLCVIPATTPRITSYVPMALIKKHSKESHCLIVLTMCDRVQPEDIQEQLLNRLVSGRTDEFIDSEYVGCIGVINRTHANKKTIGDNNVLENTWFQKNVNDILDNREFKLLPKDKQKIRAHIGIDKVLSKLDELYQKYLKQNWFPTTLCTLENKKKLAFDKLSDLGFDPADLNSQNYLSHYIDNYLLNEIKCRQLGHITTFKEQCKKYLKKNIINELDDESSIFIDGFVGINNKFDNILKERLADFIKTNSVGVGITVNPNRFMHIFDKIYDDIMSKVIEKLNSYIDKIKPAIFTDYYYCDRSEEIIAERYSRCYMKMITTILNEVIDGYKDTYTTFDEFKNLCENSETAQLRIQYTEDIEKINTAITKIKAINVKI